MPQKQLLLLNVDHLIQQHTSTNLIQTYETLCIRLPAVETPVEMQHE